MNKLVQNVQEPKVFLENSGDIKDIYANIDDCNPNREVKYGLYLIKWLLICLVIKKWTDSDIW